MKLALMLVLSLAVLSAYAQQPPRVIEYEQTQVRDGLVYEVGVADPYTGTVVEHYPNGQKKVEGNVVNGKPEGAFTAWYENGQKKVERNYVNGIREGVETEWYENGQKKTEGNVVNGQQNGVFTRWDENGQKLSETCFRNDLEFVWQEGQPCLLTALVTGTVNAQSPPTNLGIAAQAGDLEQVSALLEQGADVNAKDREGRTALILLTGYPRTDPHGMEAVATLLLERGADVNAKDNEGRTALILAARFARNTEDVVTLLLEQGADVNATDNDGVSALWNAASGGNEAVVPLLLERGADVNARTYLGGTALARAALRGREGIVSLLLDAGADVNARDHDGETPLMKAASWGFEAVVEFLLERGADVNAQDDQNKTALMWAAEGGNQKVVELLRAAGAEESPSPRTIDLNALGRQKFTPVPIAQPSTSSPVVKADGREAVEPGVKADGQEAVEPGVVGYRVFTLPIRYQHEKRMNDELVFKLLTVTAVNRLQAAAQSDEELNSLKYEDTMAALKAVGVEWSNDTKVVIGRDEEANEDVVTISRPTGEAVVRYDAKGNLKGAEKNFLKWRNKEKDGGKKLFNTALCCWGLRTPQQKSFCNPYAACARGAFECETTLGAGAMQCRQDAFGKQN